MLKSKIILLIIIGFLTYFSSFWNQFVWDDEQFIQKNIYITSFQYLPQIFSTNTVAGAGVVSNYYRPLTTLSFAVDYRLWGLHPFGFHLTNITLHILTAILIFLLLVELGFGGSLSFWISLIFLVHPIQTEAVTYMNSRGDSLYAFFLFLSLNLFYRALVEKPIQLAVRKYKLILHRWQLQILSLTFYLASLLSKEIALAAVPIYILLLLKQLYPFQNIRHLLRKYLPEISVIVLIILTIAGYMYLRLTALNFNNTLNYYGAKSPYTQHLSIRLYTFANVLWTYFSLLIWPYPLHMERDIQIVTRFLNLWVINSIILFIGLFVTSIWLWIKERNFQIIFGLVLFVSLIIPTSGIIPINGLLYEHWLYLPMIGFFIIGWNIIQSLLKQIKFASPRVLTYISASLIVVCIILTIYQNYLWSSPVTFYEYTLKYSNSARLHNNLAMAYSDQQNFAKAEPEYLKSIAMSDIYPETHHNLGNLYFAEQKYDKAEEQYLTSLDLNPNFYYSYPKLVNLYLQQGQYKKALPFIQKLSDLNPNDIQLQIVYAQILAKLGYTKDADDHYQKALRLSGFDPALSAQIDKWKAAKN